ncbi:hypothetical protein JCM10550A_23480 [Methanogenium cariaci]|jgi:hypothetical protein
MPEPYGMDSVTPHPSFISGARPFTYLKDSSGVDRKDSFSQIDPDGLRFCAHLKCARYGLVPQNVHPYGSIRSYVFHPGVYEHNHIPGPSPAADTAEKVTI